MVPSLQAALRGQGRFPVFSTRSCAGAEGEINFPASMKSEWPQSTPLFAAYLLHRIAPASTSVESPARSMPLPTALASRAGSGCSLGCRGRAPATSAGFDCKHSHTGGVVVHVVAAQQLCLPGMKAGAEGVEGRGIRRATPRVGDRQTCNSG